MSQSPSISQQVEDNSPQALFPGAIFLSEQRDLYCSTVSIELCKIEQANLVGSRINESCEHQKLLAEKDERIQELLIEIQTCKDENSFMIKQLEENVSQLLDTNRILETEISELLKQINNNNTLMLFEDKSIEELMPNILQGAHNIEKVGEEKLLNVSSGEHEKMETLLKDEEGLNIEGKYGESVSKSNIYSYFESESESLEEGITRGRLRALEEKEKLLSCFAECFTKQLDFTEEETNAFLNEPLECIISSFLESLKEHQEKRKELKELNERQSMSILDLEQVIEQHIFERRQISNEKNELKKDFDSLQIQIRPNEELKELKESFNKLLEEKKVVELELFRMKMDIEESKRMTTLEHRNMDDSMGEEERLNNDSPCTIEERDESEEESNQNSLFAGFNRKIDQLQEIVEGKDTQLKVLESRYKNHTESLEAIFELSKNFNREFCSFVDGTQMKKEEIYERISRNLKNRLRFKSAAAEVMIPNDEENSSDYFENLLHVQNLI